MSMSNNKNHVGSIKWDYSYPYVSNYKMLNAATMIKNCDTKLSLSQ